MQLVTRVVLQYIVGITCPADSTPVIFKSKSQPSLGTQFQVGGGGGVTRHKLCTSCTQAQTEMWKKVVLWEWTLLGVKKCLFSRRRVFLKSHTWGVFRGHFSNSSIPQNVFPRVPTKFSVHFWQHHNCVFKVCNFYKQDQPLYYLTM